MWFNKGSGGDFYVTGGDMAVRKHEQIFLITTFLFFQSVSLQNELILMHGDRLISTHYPLKRSRICPWYPNETLTPQWGQANPLIFSTTPRIGILVFWQKDSSLLTSDTATPWRKEPNKQVGMSIEKCEYETCYSYISNIIYTNQLIDTKWIGSLSVQIRGGGRGQWFGQKHLG